MRTDPRQKPEVAWKATMPDSGKALPTRVVCVRCGQEFSIESDRELKDPRYPSCPNCEKRKSGAYSGWNLLDDVLDSIDPW
jgi:DNA-directed RNA polymerase subunit RPC12/RpoP